MKEKLTQRQREKSGEMRRGNAKERDRDETKTEPKPATMAEPKVKRFDCFWVWEPFRENRHSKERIEAEFQAVFQPGQWKTVQVGSQLSRKQKMDKTSNSTKVILQLDSTWGEWEQTSDRQETDKIPVWSTAISVSCKREKRKRDKRGKNQQKEEHALTRGQA